MKDNESSLVPASPDNGGEFLLFSGDDGATHLQVRLSDGTVWLTQRQLAELYLTSVSNVNQHLAAIYEEGELFPEATIKKFLIVQAEGARQVRRMVDHYNLAATLAVGYRVRSLRGTQFRQWATAKLEEYLVKGFVLDDEKLKAGETLGRDYFDELLERIRDIRASERRFYQKITDIYAQCSVDYDAKAPITQTFYATVQNKLHWAIHGHTASEILLDRADADHPNMGMRTWKNAPHGPIRKSDVGIAKNYLNEEELSELNRVVTMYLDYAEDQAHKRRPMAMADWVVKLDAFLEFNERNILKNAGRVSHELALEHANAEFDKYKANLRHLEAAQPVSDFDQVVEEAKRLTGGKRGGKGPKK